MAYDTTITRLASEEWLGPASAQMAEAVKPYVSWMSRTAAQAEQAAMQARTAAGAYETALASTVHPAAVSANRTQLQSLVSSNLIGQNSPAIASTEAQYGEMWSQDAAAMYGYAGQSGAATKVTPFTEPPSTTNPAGQVQQAGAVAQAAGSSGESVQSQLVSSVSPTLSQLASGGGTAAADAGSTGGLTGLLDQLTGKYTPIGLYTQYIGPFQNTIASVYRATGMSTHLLTLGKAVAPAAKAASDGAAAAGAAAGAAGLGGFGGLGGPAGIGGGAAVSAGLGNALSAGQLSVPPTWTGAGPAMAPLTKPIPISTFTPGQEVGGAGNLLGGMPLAGAGAGGAAGSGIKYGFRPTVMARPPFAG